MPRQRINLITSKWKERYCFPHSGIYNKTAPAWFLLCSWCFLLTWLRCLIKIWFSLFLWPPCRGPRSCWYACCPRPIDQRHRGLCIEVVCRATDAICTFVNYLHLVPQIWSIVNWASGELSEWETKTLQNQGTESSVLPGLFYHILLSTTMLYAGYWFKDKGGKARKMHWMATYSSQVFTLFQQQ